MLLSHSEDDLVIKTAVLKWPSHPLGLSWDSQVVREVVKPRYVPLKFAKLRYRKNRVWFFKWDLWDLYHIWPCETSYASAAWTFGMIVYRRILNETFIHVPVRFSLIRNFITFAITAAKFGNSAKVFKRTSKWRHVVNNNSKIRMNFSPKLGSFQKNGGQIRNQWRQIYSFEHIHREYNNVS